MKNLNLDDYGDGRFSEKELTELVSWYKGRKVNPLRYRQKFNLHGGYGEKSPFVWVIRLKDWRRMERLAHRTLQDYDAACKALWGFYKQLWTNTKKEMGKPSKNLQGVLLQQLPPPGSKKKVSSYMTVIMNSRHGDEGISTTTRARKELRGDDASFYWGYLGTAEEERACELQRRNEVCMKRYHMAKAGFEEAVKIRLAAWWRHQAEERGDSQNGYSYGHRKVFTAVENDGRSYGWISGIGGPIELVWSPQEPPTFFK
jgi:hypothetical protein